MMKQRGGRSRWWRIMDDPEDEAERRKEQEVDEKRKARIVGGDRG